jgi:hypothetical protein
MDFGTMFNFASLVQSIVKRTACKSSNTFSRDGVSLKSFFKNSTILTT